jgi:hypothetical protein
MDSEVVKLLIKNLDEEIEEMHLANEGLLKLEPITDIEELEFSKMLFDIIPDTTTCLQVIINKIQTLKHLTEVFHNRTRDRLESSPLNTKETEAS